MGIRNHAWPLALLNPDLQGIDPFSTTLSEEQMIMIAIECKTNPMYFIREIIRDPKGSISNPVKFRATRGIGLYWLYFNHITTMLTVNRQSIKSFSMSALYVYLLNVACTNTTLGLLTKDNVLRTSTLTSIKDMIEELPSYLQQLTKNDIANTEEISIKSMGNRLVAQLSSKSPKQALNVSRGLSQSTIWCDELGYVSNNGIAIPAALASSTAAMALAKSKGEPYGIIYTTTAASKDDRDGRYAYNLSINSAAYSEHFLDVKDITELETVIRKNSPKGECRIYMTFSHRQLGFTDEWLRKVMELTESKGADAERDFLNIWSSGGNSSPISKDMAERIRSSEHKDHHTEISSPYGYVTRWFIPADTIVQKMSSGTYIASIDSSEAAGGDDIALIIRDVRNGSVIAAGTYNETNLITFSEWVCQLLIRFPTLTMIIERRSTGAMIMDYLLLMLPSHQIDPFARLYNRAVQDADEYPERFKEITKPMFTRSADIYIRYKKLFGFATSGSGATSRTELYGTTLQAAVKMTSDAVHDPKTIDQILSLEIKGGRCDHADGSHDDMVIAWLLGYWLLSLGKNLHVYGISPKDVLCDNITNQTSAGTTLDQYDTMQQQQLRASIETIVEQIRQERDDYVIQILEGRLKVLARQLTEQDRQVLSVDSLIDRLREQRRAAQTRRYW
jgi:hypothetical protein